LRLGALITFITVIWLMVLAVAAFLVTFVPSVQFLFKGGERSDMSSIQAVIAMGVLLLFIMGLSRLKGFYAARKLHF
jgi:hypothetical protein